MILVLGAGGLLGSHLCALYSNETIGFTREDLDITNPVAVDTILDRMQPDVVINAAGVVKSRKADPTDMLKVNGMAPHWIAKACEIRDIRMIHISSDCVFDGTRGNYAEYEMPNAVDPYGRSKLVGEVTGKKHLVVRTSFVGWPDPGGHGLMAWLFSQPRGSEVPGYSNALWNGLTVTKLCKLLVDLAYSPLDGVIHLKGQQISKYDLLNLINKEYQLGLNIFPVEEPRINRTLVNSRYVGLESVNLYTELQTSVGIHQSLLEMKQKERVVWDHLSQLSSP